MEINKYKKVDMFSILHEFIIEKKLTYINKILMYVNYPFLLISIRSSSLITLMELRE